MQSNALFFRLCCHARPAVVFLLAIVLARAAVAQQPVPEPLREFRGAWVATVHNIDWPSKPGLPAAQMKAELRAILDRAVELRLNAIVFQVRPACDALYASKLEPWSQFLTGEMGRAPEGGFDPLEYAVAEAHLRGLELHAWFNPFRAIASQKGSVSANHVTRTHPAWTRRYGSQVWLDPGDAAVREHARAVIMDVVKRYDVDGIHIDDYFYPYPVKGGGGTVSFPDDATWQRYQAGGGKLERNDWRRDNINQLVESLYRGIKAEKRWVKFGISPFGIWRPRVPETIEAGLDSYDHLFADSRKWLQEGWCDYYAPQLYWGIEPAKQSFPVLLNWWLAQNKEKRHVWPGIAADRIGAQRPASEITRQIVLSRDPPAINAGRTAAPPGTGTSDLKAPGHIHWSMKSLVRDQGGIAGLLRETYREAALVPASPWLGAEAPAAPRVVRDARGAVSWSAVGEVPARWWAVQRKIKGEWSLRVLPARATSLPREDAEGEVIAVRAIDRFGNASASATPGG